MAGSTGERLQQQSQKGPEEKETVNYQPYKAPATHQCLVHVIHGEVSPDMPWLLSPPIVPAGRCNKARPR